MIGSIVQLPQRTAPVPEQSPAPAALESAQRATPMEYLTRWRMLLAADRLTSSPDGLSAIAQSLGYESESAFGKAFRRVMGRSPRQYSRATAAVPTSAASAHPGA